MGIDERVLETRWGAQFAYWCCRAMRREETNCRSVKFTPGVLDSVRDGYKVLFPDIFYTYVPK